MTTTTPPLSYDEIDQRLTALWAEYKQGAAGTLQGLEPQAVRTAIDDLLDARNDIAALERWHALQAGTP
jgi:hypothetical protein